MSIAMAFLQLATILGICYLEYRRGSISIFLWSTLLLMFGVPHLVSVLIGSAAYGPDITAQASAFVICFNIVYLTTRLILKGRSRALLFDIREVSHNTLTSKATGNRAVVQILLMGLVTSTAMIVYYSYKMFGGLLGTSWGGFYKMHSTPYDLVSNMGFVRLAATHLLFASGGVIVPLWTNRRYASAFVAAMAVMSYAIITRNRITILPLFVAVILLYASRHRRVRIREIILTGLAAALVVYAVEALRLFRYYGSIRDFLEMFNRADFHRSIIERILEGNGELGLRNVFYYFLSCDNRFPGFGQGYTYIRLLLMPMPQRYSLGMKPEDFAISMGSAYANDFSNTTFSTHPTLYGDCYANLWWYGILLGVFWAIFVLVIDRIADRRNPVIKMSLMTLFGCMYVIVGRGSVYNGVNTGVVSGLYLAALNFLASKRIRLRSLPRTQNSMPPSNPELHY